MACGEGDEVFQGQQVAIMDAMKMEHVIQAPESGVIQSLNAELNTAIFEHHPLIILTPGESVCVSRRMTLRFRISITSDLTLPKRLRDTVLALMKIDLRR